MGRNEKKICGHRDDFSERVSGLCDYLDLGHEPKSDFKHARPSGQECNGASYCGERELEC